MRILKNKKGTDEVPFLFDHPEAFCIFGIVIEIKNIPFPEAGVTRQTGVKAGIMFLSILAGLL